ncbi:hypothetical protein [Phyllobacterium bourgognense]|uniref:hypothetical protein n=1 Tax=Phyllobacterium bourgognense TaxID=314236 RepID=UPI000DF26770|nr:hypothetical protein [Phyllobacterium bourgognense]
MANLDYPEFECQNCKAIMIAVRRNLRDSSAIVCSRCGSFLGAFVDLDNQLALKSRQVMGPPDVS